MKRKRAESGTLLIELTAGMFFLLVFALLSLNMCMLLFGISANDRACRDAARAAAQGATQAKAQALAIASLKAHASTNAFLGNPTLTYINYNPNGNATTSPQVTVTTTMTASAPFGGQLRFFKADLMQGLKNGEFVYNSTYTFPIVKLPLYNIP